MLDIIATYHYVQFQGNLMIQIQENSEKTHFGPDLGLMDPNLGRNLFFKNLTVSVTRYYGHL